MAASMESDGEETLRVCLQMLFEELDSSTLTACLHTLQKIISNVTKSNEEKFHHLKKENKTFHSKVWQYDGAQQFMLAGGWVQDDSSVHLPNGTSVETALKVLDQFISQHCSSPVPRQKTQPTPTSASKTSNTSNWSSDELTEKEKLIAEERKKLMEQLKREKEEKRRITEQIKKDRQDANTRESKDSHATHLHGGGMTKYGDIGINLNKGGG